MKNNNDKISRSKKQTKNTVKKTLSQKQKKEMNTYIVCDRESGTTEEIQAPSIEQAIEIGTKWMLEGDWGVPEKIVKDLELSFSVTPVIDGEEGDCVDATVYYSDPIPECTSSCPEEGPDDGGHNWQRPHSIVGGLEDNPGIWSCGGTSMEYKSVCIRCGATMVEKEPGNQNRNEQYTTIEIYSSGEKKIRDWMIEYYEEDGWIPEWLGNDLEIPVTTHFSKKKAEAWVWDHWDVDDVDEEDLEHVFAALIGRRPEEKDREEGLWTNVSEEVSRKFQCTSSCPKKGSDDGGHLWKKPYSLVGGSRTNPGVWTMAGNLMVFKSICALCGATETTESNPNSSESDTFEIEWLHESEQKTKIRQWMIEFHEEHGWLPNWLATDLGISVTTRFSSQEAREWVMDNADTNEPNREELDHVFGALFRRRPNDADREKDLWKTVRTYVVPR
jgi:hypothetical protein